jgi:hypothetical protein
VFCINLPMGIFGLLMITLFLYKPHYIRRGRLRVPRAGGDIREVNLPEHLPTSRRSRSFLEV